MDVVDSLKKMILDFQRQRPARRSAPVNWRKTR